MINVKQSQSAWEKEYKDGCWQFLYDRSESPRYAVVADLIRRHPGPISLLDIGGGEGVILKYLQLENIRRYVGLDLAQTALERIVPKRPQDRYICSSLEAYAPDEKWDVIDENSYSSLVFKIYKSLTDVYGFYVAFVDELISDNDDRLIPAMAPLARLMP